MIRVGIIILSDKAAAGSREDGSGPILEKFASEAGWQVEKRTVLPDDADALRKELLFLSDERRVDLVLTSGGTGLGERDITPEVTSQVIEKEVPGLSEMLRWEGYRQVPAAVLSRGCSGVRGKTLIINLPGSPRAVRQARESLAPVLPHALEVLRGEAEECASN